MAGPMTTHRLPVPGGELHHEVRGWGPLLLVVGQPMTSGPFAPVADLLADRRTVVTYDPRGLGRSSVEDASLDVTPDVEADDLARLIEAVGGGPAEVFGTSGGAVAALALAVRRPDLVRVVVAHEPPVTELLPDAAPVRRAVDAVEEAYREHGSGAAWGAFVSLVVHDGEVPEGGVPPASWPPAGDPGPQDAQEPDTQVQDAQEQDTQKQDTQPGRSAEQEAGDALFFLRMLKPFTRYQADLAALRGGSPRVVVAVGQTSGAEIAYRSAVALAERLDLEPTPFPGHHGGFMSDPEAFAGALWNSLVRVAELAGRA